MARIAATNKDLSAGTRLAVLGTAANACERAMRASSSPMFATYRECPEVTNALTLIEILSKALPTIPKGPRGALNVMPPISGDGVFAAGQSPEGIKDPIARLAYEEAIAENSKRIQEGNARLGAERALQSLENALYGVVRGLRANGKKAPHPLFDCIRASGIPEKTKKRLLDLE